MGCAASASLYGSSRQMSGDKVWRGLCPPRAVGFGKSFWIFPGKNPWTWLMPGLILSP